MGGWRWAWPGVGQLYTQGRRGASRDRQDATIGLKTPQVLALHCPPEAGCVRRAAPTSSVSKWRHLVCRLGIRPTAKVWLLHSRGAPQTHRQAQAVRPPWAARAEIGLCAPHCQEIVMGRRCMFVVGPEPHAALSRAVRSLAVRLVVGSALLLGLVAPAAAGWKGALGFWGLTAVGAGIGLAVGGAGCGGHRRGWRCGGSGCGIGLLFAGSARPG